MVGIWQAFIKRRNIQIYEFAYGRHLELPKDEFHSPDSDMQLAFRSPLAPIPSDFLGAGSCILALLYPPSSPCSVSTIPFLPPQQDSAESLTLYTQLETHCQPSPGASRVYRNNLKKPSPRLCHLSGKSLVVSLVVVRVGPGLIPWLVWKLLLFSPHIYSSESFLQPSGFM